MAYEGEVDDLAADDSNDPLNILLAREEPEEETIEDILSDYFATQPTKH